MVHAMRRTGLHITWAWTPASDAKARSVSQSVQKKGTNTRYHKIYNMTKEELARKIVSFYSVKQRKLFLTTGIHDERR